MGILSWIIFGGLVGWAATLITGHNKDTGLIENIVIGLVGAALGGFVASEFFDVSIRRFSIQGFVIAILGASVLLALFRGIRKR